MSGSESSDQSLHSEFEEITRNDEKIHGLISSFENELGFKSDELEVNPDVQVISSLIDDNQRLSERMNEIEKINILLQSRSQQTIKLVENFVKERNLGEESKDFFKKLYEIQRGANISSSGDCDEGVDVLGGDGIVGELSEQQGTMSITLSEMESALKVMEGFGTPKGRSSIGGNKRQSSEYNFNSILNSFGEGEFVESLKNSETEKKEEEVQDEEDDENKETPKEKDEELLGEDEEKKEVPDDQESSLEGIKKNSMKKVKSSSAIFTNLFWWKKKK